MDGLLLTRPVSTWWRRLLLERLDAVAVVYRLASAVANVHHPIRFRWYRAMPMDAAIALPGGRTIGIVRQGHTADRSSFAKRLWRLKEGPQLRSRPAARPRRGAAAPRPQAASPETPAETQSSPWSGRRPQRGATGRPRVAAALRQRRRQPAGRHRPHGPQRRVFPPSGPWRGLSHARRTSTSTEAGGAMPPTIMLPALLKARREARPRPAIRLALARPATTWPDCWESSRHRGPPSSPPPWKGFGLVTSASPASRTPTGPHRPGAGDAGPQGPHRSGREPGSGGTPLPSTPETGATSPAGAADSSSGTWGTPPPSTASSPPWQPRPATWAGRPATARSAHQPRLPLLPALRRKALGATRHLRRPAAGRALVWPFFLEWERRAVRPVTMTERLAPYLRYYSSPRPTDDHGARARRPRGLPRRPGSHPLPARGPCRRWCVSRTPLPLLVSHREPGGSGGAAGTRLARPRRWLRAGLPPAAAPRTPTAQDGRTERLGRDSAADGRTAPAGLRHPSHRTGLATFTASGSPSDGLDQGREHRLFRHLRRVHTSLLRRSSLRSTLI